MAAIYTDGLHKVKLSCGTFRFIHHPFYWTRTEARNGSGGLSKQGSPKCYFAHVYLLKQYAANFVISALASTEREKTTLNI